MIYHQLIYHVVLWYFSIVVKNTNNGNQDLKINRINIKQKENILWI
jgi:hypothetical protein